MQSGLSSFLLGPKSQWLRLALLQKWQLVAACPHMFAGSVFMLRMPWADWSQCVGIMWDSWAVLLRKGRGWQISE